MFEDCPVCGNIKEHDPECPETDSIEDIVNACVHEITSEVITSAEVYGVSIRSKKPSELS